MKDKFKIYLSGGMSAFGKENFEMSNFWRKQVKDYFANNYPDKVKVFNPNDSFNFAEEPTYESEREVMEVDLFHLRNSDIVFHYANDPRSLGTMAELAIAYEKRIPIITISDNPESLHPWINCFTNRTFSDLEDACLYIIKHYVGV